MRMAGHDVVAIAEICKGIPDQRVMERAFNDGRVLITEDSDFGELVYARGRPSVGVIFVKFDSRARRSKPMAVVETVAEFGERLFNSFAVVEPGRVRLAKRP